ncbi:nitronate monooxygenase [Streptomyces sp. NBC_00102]|uniref:nitronate monooxygenase n=1 Tax=Streptomyces sp. NBC_00102 TaxID=2975652 RepID=UPI0022505D10|nr:nitronate monooxygenase [Streptomyces sp. NBC_00102]MCX5396952.1 nitronate monooxygenase [Streptomyces sp. NBC_00102]
MSSLTDLCRYPIVQAPMAGGPSSPQLVAAVAEAGGLGFLAAGYKTADAMRHEIEQVRAATGGAFGVNLFMPQPALADPAAVAAYQAYRGSLAAEAATYGTPLGDPGAGGGDDAWDTKVAALLAEPVPVVSFTFGCPTRDTLDAFARAGTYTIVTVTTAEEARDAQWAGADAVCAQGIEAGGHQSTHHDDPRADHTGIGLLSLITQVRETVDIPVVAAGGMMRGAQIAAALTAGADAAQLGTAFLACPESGAHPLHKQALTSPMFVRTALTRAFSGRPARSLVNRFVREHGPDAPAAYPQVHHVTSGLRGAAARAGDAQGMALWAGQGHRMARELPAGELVELLAAELRTAGRG